MIQINSKVSIDERELEFAQIRASGPGGQNVNKVSSAVQLRFDIKQSGLPDFYKWKLLQSGDQRITKDGVLVIKAQRHRTQIQNREDAVSRLLDLVRTVCRQQRPRRATAPTQSSQRKRVDKKVARGKTKALRVKIRNGNTDQT